MVEIHNDIIKEKPCDLYGPDGKLIGTIENVLAFDDVRLQIKENKLEGYYIVFEDESYEIDKNGRLWWPEGLFNKFDELIVKLL